MSRTTASHLLVAIAVAIACALAPLAVVAQTPPPQQSAVSAYDDYFMSDEHRQKIYEENRQRPHKAVLYTLLLPGLGNVYAEQYLLAGLSFIFAVFAATFIGYGAVNSQPRIIAIGGVVAGVAYGGGIATSLIGVSDNNRRLRRGLKVDKTDVREVWTPTLVMRF